MNTPILFLIFNRIDTTRQVFERIREVKPARLYIAADGPRHHKEGEAEKCQQTRAIIDYIDWDCELKVLFSKENLGCGLAVSSAITWFFEQEEEGIILEDDCLPHLDFFQYCSELLEKYRNDERISMISGDNFQDGIKRTEYSYYFSAYSGIWGWATWRRVWLTYRYDILDYDMETLQRQANITSQSLFEKMFWQDIIESTKNKRIDTWDLQFALSNFYFSRLSIVPNVNLVSNIGFGEEATHTVNSSSHMAEKQTSSILPLVYTKQIERMRSADSYYVSKYVVFGWKAKWDYIKRYLLEKL